MPLPVWRYPFRDPVMHTLSAMTEVIFAATAHEQRRKLRLSPRHGFTFAFQVEANTRSRFELDVARHAGGEWELPLAVFGQALAAPLTAGATVIPASTANRGFVAGGRALLIDYVADSFELVEIDSFDADEITLADPTAATWSAGTRLMPVRRANMVEAPAMGLFTDDFAYGDVEFELAEPLDWGAYTWATTYRGLPVLPIHADTYVDPTVTLARSLMPIDVGTGPVTNVDLPAVPLTGMQFAYTAFGWDEIVALYGLVNALAGRLASVWVTASARDFVPVASAAAASTTLDVRAFGLADGDLPATRRDIRIICADGTVTHRRITGVTVPGAGVERLQLDGAIGGDIAPGDGAVISWLWLARQAADVNALGYWMDDVVETTFQFEGFNHDL
ncbi:MAG TPA: hypothetical protein VLC71_05880 [Thermomonas sp.]|nr:hypothetical protein [Thermomonas sp.]